VGATDAHLSLPQSQRKSARLLAEGKIVAVVTAQSGRAIHAPLAR
jgi:hypothetical protein